MNVNLFLKDRLGKILIEIEKIEKELEKKGISDEKKGEIKKENNEKK